MGLYQLVRPNDWKDIVGNNKVVGALKGLVKRKSEDRPHAILLKGPKGCGKTTIAKLLAREFGAKQAIEEFNAANTRGIDTVRDIVASMSLGTLDGGTKAYILDESHQLTKAAQEAFLKDTEETPDHCYIFFCTTNPENIIPTLRNRFTEYEVNPLSNKNILKVLQRACKVKDLKVSDDVLEIIACNSNGTARTALVLLEKVMDVPEDAAIELLVTEIDSENHAFDLARMLLRKPEVRKRDWKKIHFMYSTIKETDSERIRYAILGFLRKQYKAIAETDEEYAIDVTKLIRHFSESTFHGKKDQLLAMVMEACLILE
jgi:DNA polymerase III gamma/tau subunit